MFVTRSCHVNARSVSQLPSRIIRLSTYFPPFRSGWTVSDYTSARLSHTNSPIRRTVPIFRSPTNETTRLVNEWTSSATSQARDRKWLRKFVNRATNGRYFVRSDLVELHSWRIAVVQASHRSAKFHETDQEDQVIVRCIFAIFPPWQRNIRNIHRDKRNVFVIGLRSWRKLVSDERPRLCSDCRRKNSVSLKAFTRRLIASTQSMFRIRSTKIESVYSCRTRESRYRRSMYPS